MCCELTAYKRKYIKDQPLFKALLWVEMEVEGAFLQWLRYIH